jgi:phosphoribosyl 1,2-cyclic phosphodiesterase
MANPADGDPAAPEPTSNRVSICMLASGSKGNAIYISSGQTTLLIDAGFSGVEIERRFKARGLLPDQVDALLVSHEHNDHLHGVGVLARRYDLPVYMSAGTQAEAESKLGRIKTIAHFDCGTDFRVNDILIHPFATSHDAADPAGFTLQIDGQKIGIATDLGIATKMVRHHLKGCACIVLEANHDPRMLEEGPYPWPIKQRIKSRTGHLSNDDSKALLMDVMHDSLRHVILAHISETNNTPEKALSVVAERLDRNAPQLTVALQDVPSPLIYL